MFLHHSAVCLLSDPPAKNWKPYLSVLRQAADVGGYVRLPACVTPKQRAILHALAEQHSLQHTSVGEGDARQLLLGHSQETLKVRAGLICRIVATA